MNDEEMDDQFERDNAMLSTPESLPDEHEFSSTPIKERPMNRAPVQDEVLMIYQPLIIPRIMLICWIAYQVQSRHRLPSFMWNVLSSKKCLFQSINILAEQFFEILSKQLPKNRSIFLSNPLKENNDGTMRL
jgi:hypothetical protein